jgi:hypothetical protein
MMNIGENCVIFIKPIEAEEAEDGKEDQMV